MTPDQITTLAASGESETLECKATTGMRREAARTVCAMLNQRGGHVLFGVTPDGNVTGQQVGERTIEEISAEIRRIEPPAFPAVERVRVKGEREVVAIIVSRGPTQPYTYRGAAYRRIGNTTVALSSDEYGRMLFERMHSERRWENQTAAGWRVEDLDADEIRRTVAEAVRRGRLAEPGSMDPQELLRGLGLLRDGALCRAAGSAGQRPVPKRVLRLRFATLRTNGGNRSEVSYGLSRSEARDPHGGAMGHYRGRHEMCEEENHMIFQVVTGTQRRRSGGAMGGAISKRADSFVSNRPCPSAGDALIGP